MTTSRSLIYESQVGCGKCHQPFSYKMPVVINAATDPQYVEQLKDMSLLMATCNHCGFSAPTPIIFLYHNPDQSILWAITSESYEVRFQQLRNIVGSISSDYLKTLPPEEAKMFRSLTWQLIPLGIFLQKIGSSLAKGKGLGFIHFYPFPQVTVDESLAIVKDFEPTPAVQIKDFDVGLAEGNYPDFYNTLWGLMHDEFQHRRQYVHTEKVTEPKKPIGTYGFPELLLYIGSSVVLPIAIGTLSNLISDLILEKRKTKQQLEESLKEARQNNHPQFFVVEERAKKIINAQDNEMLPSDKIQVRLQVLNTKKEYIFRGSIREVYKQLKTFRHSILRSVRISDDCHIANYIGDHYVDATIENKEIGIGKSAELAKRYGKLFSKSTRVRFADGKQGDYLSNSTHVCAKARALMSEENYEEAILLLQDELCGDETSIEVLYNYALCLDALSYEDEANFIYEQILIRAINLPSLEDTAKVITGMPLGEEKE